jgi:hypothetical protein
VGLPFIPKAFTRNGRLPPDPDNCIRKSGSHTGSPSTPNDIIVSHECRAMVDKCMQLARTARSTQQRDELFDAALLLLRVASSYDDALPDLPSVSSVSALVPTISAWTSTKQVLTADDNIRYFPDQASKLTAKTLEALPEASTLTCNTAQLAESLSTVWPDTPACTKIERIAKACQCSWLLVEETGTVSFTKDTSLAKSVGNNGQISGADEKNEDGE